MSPDPADPVDPFTYSLADHWAADDADPAAAGLPGETAAAYPDAWTGTEPDPGPDPDPDGLAEVLAVDQDPTVVLGGQKEMVEGGAWLVGKAGNDGVPVNRTIDNVGGVTVVVEPFPVDDGRPDAPPHERLVYTIDGLNDPVVTAVAARQAAAGVPDTPRARAEATFRAHAEIARRKGGTQPTSRAHPAGGRPPRPPEAAAAPAPGHRAVQVVFDFGPLGRQVGTYVDAFIHGGVLVLVGDPARHTVYVPPAPDPDRDPAPIRVVLPGLGPVRVYPTGVGFPYRGSLFCVLTVDREDDLPVD